MLDMTNFHRALPRIGYSSYEGTGIEKIDPVGTLGKSLLVNIPPSKDFQIVGRARFWFRNISEAR